MKKFAKRILQRSFELAGIGHLSSVGMHHIDLQLFAILNRQKNGYFIEAGANDGVAQSNTYILEKAYGWHGLLIEPLPRLASLCRKSRPGSKVIQAALVSKNFDGEIVTIEDANLMSVVRDGAIDNVWITNHVGWGRKCQGMQDEQTIDVPARTLDSILAVENVKEVDLFSLDVEGYEYQVLQGLSLDKYTIKNIFVETRKTNESEIDEYLVRFGYRCEYSWVTPEYTNKLYTRI